MKAAPNDFERERIRKVRLDIQEKRSDFEAAEKLRIATRASSRVARIKECGRAKFTKPKPGSTSSSADCRGTEAVPWWDQPAERGTGKLARSLPAGERHAPTIISTARYDSSDDSRSEYARQPRAMWRLASKPKPADR